MMQLSNQNKLILAGLGSTCSLAFSYAVSSSLSATTYKIYFAVGAVFALFVNLVLPRTKIARTFQIGASVSPILSSVIHGIYLLFPKDKIKWPHISKSLGFQTGFSAVHLVFELGRHLFAEKPKEATATTS